MVRFLGLSLIPLAASAIQIAETQASKHDFEGMKASMLGIAATSTNGKISEAQAKAIQGFLDELNNVLYPAIDADRNASQNTLDVAKSNLNQCNRNKETWVAGDLATGASGVSTKKQTHDSCRAQENVTLTNLTNYCKTYEEEVCGWEICPVPTFSNGDSDAVFDYICCLDTFFDTYRTSFASKRQACIDATNLHHQQTALCDTQQGEYETEFCDHEEDIQDACKTYEDCRCEYEAEYEDVKKCVEDMEAVFQAQHVALNHLRCYGTQILINATDLTGCNSLKDECEAIVPSAAEPACPEIDYSAPEDPVDCDEPHKDHPCDASWLSDNYAQYDDGCTPVHDCTPCTTTAHAQVVDDTWTGSRKKTYAVCDSFP